MKIRPTTIRITTITLLLGFVITSCSESHKKFEVSIFDLIVRPDEYRGKQIITEGFLNVDDKPRLFVSRDDAIYKIKANSVRLSKHDFNNFDDLKPCDQSYVQIAGKFNQELALESLQYIYSKNLSSKLLNQCWGKTTKEGLVQNETTKH